VSKHATAPYSASRLFIQAMMSAIWSGAYSYSGMAGWPERMPSARASSRDSSGYFSCRVRNGGAGPKSLSPTASMAWQAAQSRAVQPPRRPGRQADRRRRLPGHAEDGDRGEDGQHEKRVGETHD